MTVTQPECSVISSSLSASRRLSQIGRNSVKAFLRYRVNKLANGVREVTVTLNFDHQNLISSSFRPSGRLMQM